MSFCGFITPRKIDNSCVELGGGSGTPGPPGPQGPQGPAGEGGLTICYEEVCEYFEEF